jgi:hypothetical protein
MRTRSALAALESRIAQGVRGGDVGPGLDPRASVVMNTVVGLRGDGPRLRRGDAVPLCRIAGTALAVLDSASAWSTPIPLPGGIQRAAKPRFGFRP